jgi:hypothetical protein
LQRSEKRLAFFSPLLDFFGLVDDEREVGFAGC